MMGSVVSGGSSEKGLGTPLPFPCVTSYFHAVGRCAPNTHCSTDLPLAASPAAQRLKLIAGTTRWMSGSRRLSGSLVSVCAAVAGSVAAALRQLHVSNDFIAVFTAHGITR